MTSFVRSGRPVQDLRRFHRIKILYGLFESEMCVCAIAELLGMSQSAISHQLKVLKVNNLDGNRREGKTIYYYLRMNTSAA